VGRRHSRHGTAHLGCRSGHGWGEQGRPHDGVPGRGEKRDARAGPHRGRMEVYRRPRGTSSAGPSTPSSTRSSPSWRPDRRHGHRRSYAPHRPARRPRRALPLSPVPERGHPGRRHPRRVPRHALPHRLRGFDPRDRARGRRRERDHPPQEPGGGGGRYADRRRWRGRGRATPSGWRTALSTATTRTWPGSPRPPGPSWARRPGRGSWFLGAGGAARAAVVALMKARADAVHVLNRATDRARRSGTPWTPPDAGSPFSMARTPSAGRI
jgi:hypothetical protein